MALQSSEGPSLLGRLPDCPLPGHIPDCFVLVRGERSDSASVLRDHDEPTPGFESGISVNRSGDPDRYTTAGRPNILLFIEIT